MKHTNRHNMRTVLARCAISGALVLGFCVPAVAYADVEAVAEGIAGSLATYEQRVDHAQAVDEAYGAGTKFAAGELLVAFEDGTTRRQAQRALQASGIDGDRAAADVPTGKTAGDFASVEVPEDVSVVEAVAKLSENSHVASVQPNYIYRLQDEESAWEVDDTSVSRQWYLDAIGVREAWNETRCEGSVTVAVLDTGADIDHPDLVENIVGAKDVAGNKTSEYATPTEYSPDDENGHGTHVCGIIAAQANNTRGVAGVSYNAGVMPVKVFYNDDGTTSGSTKGWGALSSDIAAGYSYLLGKAESDVDGDGTIGSVAEEYNVRVVSMSFGLGICDEDNNDTPAVDVDLDSDGDIVEGTDALVKGCVHKALKKGIVSVGAAGNEKVETDSIWPAHSSEVVGVTATKSDGSFDSEYSNYGEANSISAPGTNIYSTYLDGSYSNMSGTSMATPVVSAVLALMFAANPQLTVAEATELLCATATDAGDEGFDKYYGHGIVNAKAAVHAVNQQCAQKVADQILALGAPESLALDDEGSVEAARAAYDALPQSQKSLVGQDAITALGNAENRIIALKQQVADAVTTMLSALDPSSLTLGDAQSVENARVAYDALSGEIKALVSADALANLQQAEARIDALKASGEQGGSSGDGTSSGSGGQSGGQENQDPVNGDDTSAGQGGQADAPNGNDNTKQESQGSAPSDASGTGQGGTASSADTSGNVDASSQPDRVAIASGITYDARTATATIDKATVKKADVKAAVKAGATKFVLGSKVKTVTSKAFSSATKATSVVIGKNVKRICAQAFKGCKKLKTIVVKSAKLKTKKSLDMCLKGSKVKTVKFSGLSKAKKKNVKKAFKNYSGRQSLKFK